mmetsp:Transcript_55910/g.149004  ORF Transcript_55910/g.149004 Transcript_55910/m.149004 type:complete len:200 (+) Transcript_55910:1451-2050(+)
MWWGRRISSSAWLVLSTLATTGRTQPPVPRTQELRQHAPALLPTILWKTPPRPTPASCSSPTTGTCPGPTTTTSGSPRWTAWITAGGSKRSRCSPMQGAPPPVGCLSPTYVRRAGRTTLVGRTPPGRLVPQVSRPWGTTRGRQLEILTSPRPSTSRQPRAPEGRLGSSRRREPLFCTAWTVIQGSLTRPMLGRCLWSGM